MSAGDAAVGVEIDLHFGHRELERAALEAAGAEDHRQLVHSREQRVDFGRQSRKTLADGFLFAEGGRLGRRSSCARYSSTSSYVNRRRLLIAALEDVGRDADAFFGELHHGREGVANFVRLQAGQVVGDDLRQHRNHAIGQVDARGAVVRFAIERRFRLDEVRDVGDVDAQQPVAVVECVRAKSRRRSRGRRRGRS